MKKIKLLLMALIFTLVLTPFAIRAEEEVPVVTSVVEKAKINVYMFRGEGCSFCAKAMEFFDSIEEEYGKYYNLVTYETWNDQENAAFMQEIGDYLDTEISGVPFIMIGKETYPGFDISYGEAIKQEIVAEYNREETDRTDYISDYKSGAEKKKDDTTLETVIMLVIVAGIIGFIIYARRSTDSKEETRKVVKEEKRQEYKEAKLIEEDDDEEVEKKEVKKQPVKKSNLKKAKTSKK